ncbi:gas vesicle protein [Haloarchaeobius sp. HRN-SO-5]|uniref:gas vesicle protein GvpO n=1 Tax=Haloarchaeobius sp. HRN-SO-5 TaxID=3446118 RepID=UPI003EB9EBA9
MTDNAPPSPGRHGDSSDGPCGRFGDADTATTDGDRPLLPDGGTQTSDGTGGGESDVVDELETLTTAEDEDGSFGVLDARQTAETVAEELLDGAVDGVTEVRRVDDGWVVVVELLERRAIPDTQDILGRYELELEDEGTVRGYERIDRYRRGDTSDRE